MKYYEADVIIIGAGLTGLAAALALAKLKLSVLVIDKNPVRSLEAAALSPRVLALRQQSDLFLAELGIDVPRSVPVLDICIHDKEANQTLSFSDGQVSSVATIVEQPLLLNALLEAANASKDIEILSGHVLTEIHPMKDKIQCLFETITVNGQLLIGADGSDSVVRRDSGINVEQQDYHQKALVCLLKLAEPHRHIARQWFGSQGPLAFLPLSDPNMVSIVWSLNEATANEWSSDSDEQIAQYIADYADQSTPTIVSARYLFPLKSLKANRYTAERTVLLGESAHVIHPLAGQGFNLSVSDVAMLAKRIASAAGNGYSHPRVLRAYERARQFENQSMDRAMHLIDRVFKNDCLIPFRRYGLRALQSHYRLKQLVLAAAAGGIV